MKKRILLLTQWFDPEPTFKGLVFARELVARGYDVEVVTGFPNYPGGKIYPGHRVSWKRHERIDGIDVTRLALYPSHDSSIVRRTANYASFAATAALYCLFGARRPDLVYVYQLPTTAAVAVLTTLFRGVPFVYDVQDIWPDTLRATGMVHSPAFLAAVGAATNWLYRHAPGLIVNSNGFRRLLIARGVPANRIEVVLNWCDEQSLKAPSSSSNVRFPGEDRFRILFAGNIGLAQSLDAVLDAAERLLVRAPKVQFAFIGGGVDVERLRARAAEKQLTNVVFLPRVGMNEVGEFIRQADAVLVHLKPDPLFSITIPGKTQAYMAMGKPILMAVEGSAAELVMQAECGVRATPGDAESIADAAMQLAALPPSALAAMGQRGKTYYDSNLSVQAGVEKIARVFERVMESRPAGTLAHESL